MDVLQSYARAETMPQSQSVRIARLLSLEASNGIGELELARMVARGLPTEAVAALARILGSAQVVGPLVPEVTYRRARRQHRALSRQHSERLYEAGRVLDLLSRLYHGDKPRIEAFLYRPHPMLDGETPFDVMRSSAAGADAVVSLLQRAEAGVAA